MVTLRSNSTDSRPRSLGILPEFELRSLGDYAAIIRKRWLLATVCSSLSGAVVAWFLLSRPPVFQATSSLLIERQGARVVDFQEVIDTSLDGPGHMWQAMIENHRRQLTSRKFFEYVETTISQEEADRFLEPYIGTREMVPPSQTLLNLMAENITVEQLGSSFVLQIRVRHRDPSVAVWFADRFAEQYGRFSLEGSLSGNQTAIAFLEEQAEVVARRLHDADRAAQEYRKKHNLVFAEESQNNIVQRLSELGAAVTSARIARIGLDSQLKQVEEFEKEGKDLVDIAAITSFGSISELRQELDRLRRQRDAMNDRYADRHPLMVKNELETASAERQMKENIAQAVASLRARQRNALEVENTLLAEQAQAERESHEIDALSISYQVLKNNADSLRATYAQLVTRLNETSIASRLTPTNIKVVDSAAEPGRPIEPDLKKVAVLVLFLGVVVFVGLPIGLDSIDKTVKTPRDVDILLGQSLIGAIPAVDSMASDARSHVFSRGGDEAAAEAFRGIVAQMLPFSIVNQAKVVLVTSTLPSEGKTFLINNLAHALAAHGKRILLVDADLRRPRLHHCYGLENDVGLIPWLASIEDARDSIESSKLGLIEVGRNVFLLRSGGQCGTTTECLSNSRLESLLAALRDKFDLVLVDSPPAGVFPDALALARLSDECVYVVRFGKVDYRRANASISHLVGTRARVLGIAVNGIKSSHRSEFYQSGNAYGDPKYHSHYSRGA